jgi:hypothetical protein
MVMLIHEVSDPCTKSHSHLGSSQRFHTVEINSVKLKLMSRHSPVTVPNMLLAQEAEEWAFDFR